MSTIVIEQAQRPDGTVLGGAWSLIEAQTASSDATIDVINLSSEHFLYKFFWANISPASDNVNLTVRTSSDNGSTWDSAASSYAWATQRYSSGVTYAEPINNSTGATAMGIFNDQGSGTDETSSLEMTLFNPSGTTHTRMIWEGTTFRATTESFYYRVIGGGTRLSAASVNGVRFLYSSGNIASGILRVYGISAS